MKIASWNVNSLKVRLPQVLNWINLNKVDVLCLQETKSKITIVFHITSLKKMDYSPTIMVKIHITG